MAYTDIDKPSDYFETLLSTGDGGSQTFTGLDFQPDWVWSKRRQTHVHQLYDSVRTAGSGKALQSDSTAAEGGDGGTYGYLSSFTSDGFASTAGSSNNNYFNADGGTYVFWNWKAGTSLNNSAGSNNGSIASTGSFSTAAGFSIVKWAGSNAAGTIYTGLSGKIDFVILKNLSTTRNWIVKPKSFAANDVLYFQATNATVNAPGDGWINILSATNGTIGLVAGGSNTNPLKNVNENNANYIAYCFQEKTGFSKFGSYKGNGNADGTFVYTGFKPAFVIIKDTAARDWIMLDNKRNPFNVADNRLFPNSTDAQNTGVDALDFTAQGFKIRSTNSTVNVSGNTYIYIAFAEQPFVTSTGIPATAR